MTGEARMVRGALTWSVGLAVPATLIAGFTAGREAAASIACAALVIALNLALTIAFERIGRRFDAKTQVIMTLPTLAVRMIVALTALSILRTQTFIDAQVFVAAFCVTLILALVLQSRDYKRTPWLALAFTPAKKEIV